MSQQILNKLKNAPKPKRQKYYLVGIPFIVFANNKKEAQKQAQDAMIKLNQFSPSAAKSIIPLKNVVPEGSKKSFLNLRLT